jgi:formate dehydrogenase major subunit
VPGLGATLGRGGATTAQQDLVNADAILIVGSSMAEAHPVGFRWVMQARERGALVIHVDPRFSRTSAAADLWAPLRAGSDIVFFGGLIHYVLTRGRVFRDYVVAYTNAATLIRDDYAGPDDLAGLFSGWDPAAQAYDTSSWQYDRDRDGRPRRDVTLEHPRCVYQHLLRHFARYTPEMVERVCGIPQAVFLDIADRYTSCSGPDRTATICYAVGLTQHSVGAQVVRSAAILQLLLGNIGRPGGGILALRGHASIQGSTDIPTLYDLLPGYLPMPEYGPDSATLSRYVARYRKAAGVWSLFDTFIVSLLRAWYGEAATADSDFGFGWLPRISGDHSHQGYWLEMADGRMDGLFVMGQNPAVGAPNAALERRALRRLQWLVVRDMVEVETATFWKDSPEVQAGEIAPAQIGTEVFFFPAAGHAEKAGSFTNTQRLVQWHEKAVDPPGQSRSDAWFVFELGRRLKTRAERDPQPWNDGLRALTWDYPATGPHGEPDAEAVLREINGWRVDAAEETGTTAARSTAQAGRTSNRSARRSLPTFTQLAADGSTACGCWIYAGVFSGGVNRARGRDARGPYGHGWGYAWPVDRRVLYNRASARPDGRPWSDAKKLVWWDEARGEWTGLDTPDFPRTTPPAFVPAVGAQGLGTIGGGSPFIMHEDGLGWLWAPAGLADGPLPAHYEPLESPVRNAMYEQQANPAANRRARDDNRWASSPDADFPYVLTTYRLTEHHTAGGMSRTLSHLAELQPALFCEISPELAREARVRPGTRVRIVTMRGQIEAHALVTPRMRPLSIDGRVVHQVALPFHFGHRGLVTGDVANDLVAISEEPNVRIMESKALLCRVEPATSARR